MQCERAADLIGAYLDQELDADTRREVAAHLSGCTACAAAADDLGRISRQVASVRRETASKHLASKVDAVLDGAYPPATEPGVVGQAHAHRWMRQVAIFLLACAVTVAVTVLITLRGAGIDQLERDVTAAHVRSLLQDNAVQIASSDTHAVKPWFAGRLDFAPSVKDLTEEGFPLAGARLDYVGERRVAALVYRRRLHVVSVFLWPAADGSDRAPQEFVRNGYNVLSWSRGGIAYWAISDLNSGELRQLQGLL